MRASESTLAWLRSYYALLDHRRFDEVAPFLREDCRNQYPNGAVVCGREQIMRVLRRGLESLAEIHHELQHAWQEENEVIFELRVTYRRRDGREIVRPGVGVFVVEDGLIAAQRLFVDPTGVWD